MSSNIFLTSSVHLVADSIGKKLDSNNKHQSLLFIKTAAEIEEKKGDNLDWMYEDIKALENAGFLINQYSITGKSLSDIKNQVDQSDGIYMEGGNSFYLLYQMHQTKSFDFFKDYINTRRIYIGTSAGSIITAPNILDSKKDKKHAEWAEKLKDHSGLGYVNFILYPHWGSQYFKDDYLKERMIRSYKLTMPIILLNDYQYVEVFKQGYQIVDVRNEK